MGRKDDIITSIPVMSTGWGLKVDGQKDSIQPWDLWPGENMILAILRSWPSLGCWVPVTLSLKGEAKWPSTIGDKVWSRIESPGCHAFFFQIFFLGKFSSCRSSTWIQGFFFGGAGHDVRYGDVLSTSLGFFTWFWWLDEGQGKIGILFLQVVFVGSQVGSVVPQMAELTFCQRFSPLGVVRPGYPGWLLFGPPGSLKERLSAKRLKELAAEAPGTEERRWLVFGI